MHDYFVFRMICNQFIINNIVIYKSHEPPMSMLDTNKNDYLGAPYVID